MTAKNQVQPVNDLILNSDTGEPKGFRRLLLGIARRICVTLTLVCTTVVGGLVLRFCEKENELLEYRRRSAVVDQFSDEICSIVDSNATTNCQESIFEIMKRFENHTNLFKMVHKYGVDGNKTRWSLGEASFVAFTAYSTIGYGVITPITSSGRIALMIYASLAIPLFLYIMTDIGSVLHKSMDRVWRRLFKMCRKVVQCRDGANPNFIQSTFDRPMPIFLLILATYIYLCIGAVMFYMLQDWTFLEAFYYCFQTLCTIGFGDVYPPQSSARSVTLIYIIFGLAVMSIFFNAISDDIAKGDGQVGNIAHRIENRLVSINKQKEEAVLTPTE